MHHRRSDHKRALAADRGPCRSKGTGLCQPLVLANPSREERERYAVLAALVLDVAVPFKGRERSVGVGHARFGAGQATEPGLLVRSLRQPEFLQDMGLSIVGLVNGAFDVEAGSGETLGFVESAHESVAYRLGEMGMAMGFGEDALHATFWIYVGKFVARPRDEVTGGVLFKIGEGVGNGADQAVGPIASQTFEWMGADQEESDPAQLVPGCAHEAQESWIAPALRYPVLQILHLVNGDQAALLAFLQQGFERGQPLECREPRSGLG